MFGLLRNASSAIRGVENYRVIGFTVMTPHQNACGSDDWNLLLNRVFSGIVVIDDKQVGIELLTQNNCFALDTSVKCATAPGR